MNNMEYEPLEPATQEIITDLDEIISDNIRIITDRIKDMSNDDQDWEIDRFTDKIKNENLETIDFYHRILGKSHAVEGVAENKIIDKLYDRVTLLRYKRLFNE